MPAPGRPRGRRPIDPDDRLSVPLTLRLPSRQYDQLYRQAAAARCSPPEYVRRALRPLLRRPEEP